MKNILNLSMLCSLWLLIPFACAVNPTPKTDIAQKLQDNLSVVEYSTEVIAGKLKVISAAEARQQALKNATEIAGYPIADKTFIVNAKQREAIKKIILKDNNYIVVSTRCLNTDFLGIRFNQDDKKVEFALGMPCNQVIWAYPTNQGTQLWGGVLSEKASKRLLLTVESINQGI